MSDRDLDALLAAKVSKSTLCATCKNADARALSFALAKRNEESGTGLTITSLHEIVMEEVPGYTASITSFRRHLRRCKP